LFSPSLITLVLPLLLTRPPSIAAEDIRANDNLTPAGTHAEGVLRLHLRAAVGTWQPAGESGQRLQVEAFGEVGKSLSVPAPLLRVREGTEVVASVRNDLPHPLRIHGLCERGGAACRPIEVAPAQTEEIRFKSGVPGTYNYWATTTGMPQQFRGADDSQLSGAFIVDATDAAVQDRILVITEWTSITRSQLQDLARSVDPGAAFFKLRPDVFFAMNGRIWPHTERLRYTLSDTVRWRIVNLSTQVHPMHLHGFYFNVDSVGDGLVDRPSASGRAPRVVTQVMPPGTTMSMTWTPERAGNWLFHCHVMTHVSPVLHVDGSLKAEASHDHGSDPRAGMTGMVMGITVDGPPAALWPSEPSHARKLTLSMQEEAHRYGDAPALAFSLVDDDGKKAAPSVPGPTLVLTRGEPVEITLVNRMSRATAIHWHGMELESYYDGVHGWGRTGERVTPMIEPGASFVVRFTPPRSGTFMYHSHLHDHAQLTSGLYGAMLVLDPGKTFDDKQDHVLVLGRDGPQPGAAVVINGSSEADDVWKAGTSHRLRLINITPDDILVVSVSGADGPTAWTALTKDGAPVGGDGKSVPAKQLIAVGETYDFEFTAPAGRTTLWIEVRSTGGRWMVQRRVILR
jgi:FtsP/CotA-like multicopper oxidase with cupredoxin domain